MLASENSINVIILVKKRNTIKQMKNLFFFVALAIGLSSCTEHTILTVERLDGKIQQINGGLSTNKVGDTIIVEDIYQQGQRGTTKYYGNFRGELPDTWCDTDTSGKVIYSSFTATAVVRKVDNVY